MRDIFEMGLAMLLIFSLIGMILLDCQNVELLNQVDIAIGKFNEINYKYELLINEYEELKNKYEYVVDFIRTSDRYQLPQEMEE